ncbi:MULTISPECIES: organic hydroperoxide resistance protein [unclassified Aureimonas]|uniref:organic hydroperoxide resistance protein n=1 Tax=unclassified Aureimonas TaxID=2615206 RepID=UPI00071F4C2F|nr:MULTISPECIES: organic hydroperoxide resistance protein [unclassified Aureimonas]ALN71577.1 Organic hydroperoxide resistance protein [Aureimonas sp. AU20]
MPVDVIYKTKATANGGGRDGAARSEDGSVDVKLVVPKEMGGPGGDGANPEKLFAAGYSACFLGAMRAISSKVGVKVPAEATVTAEVGFGPRSEGGYGITADLTIDLPGVDPAEGEKLIAAAHEICPYSNATRGNLDVGLTLA